MALRDMDDNGNLRDILKLDHDEDFNRIWHTIAPRKRQAIENEINLRLDR